MKLNIPKRVRLIPKTSKGKQRVKQWGAEGNVVGTASEVQFSKDKGLWILVEAGDITSRWVNVHRDKDFRVEVL